MALRAGFRADIGAIFWGERNPIAPCLGSSAKKLLDEGHDAEDDVGAGVVDEDGGAAVRRPPQPPQPLVQAVHEQGC